MAILNTRSTNGSSKSAIATRIYQEMAASKESFTRKQIIERFISEAGLTAAGAATYYFNITKKAANGGDVVVSVPAVTTKQELVTVGGTEQVVEVQQLPERKRHR
jgi:hypothetical protein